MRSPLMTICLAAALATVASLPAALAEAPRGGPSSPPGDPIATLVGRLDLERYKATIRGLTQFGDRRQGTDRNRAAIDWIEAQLKSYGCANTERLHYAYTPDEKPQPSGPPKAAGPDAADGGGRLRGNRAPTGVNTDPTLQPDEKLRALNTQPSAAGPREEVYCTKVGTTHPEEMYIVGAHMDGHGWGEAANDDGSGTALVMELARVLSSPDVKTERSIRFVLWNNEETGLNGAYAYVAQRAKLQGIESPPGSGQFPEPRWLGMIQHDMLLFDHGMPRADGTVSHGSAAGGGREHRVPVAGQAGRGRAKVGMGPVLGQRGLRDRLSGRRRPAHDQHRLDALHGSRARDQRARKRARHADRRRLGPAVASADGSVRDLSMTPTFAWG